MPDSSWFQRSSTAGSVRLHLVCFPGVGGRTTAYQTWPALLPPGVEVCSVQLPGRGSRWRDRAQPRIGPMAAEIARAAREELAGPCLLFGFSFGALLGYEVARRLSAAGSPPKHYVAMASRPPHLTDHGDSFHKLEDDQLVEVLRELDATPDEFFDDPDLLELFLPALRADFEAAATYVPSCGDPLPVPITAIATADDPYASTAHLAAWQRWTSEQFTMRVVPGGHFVLDTPGHRTVPEILYALTRHPAVSRGA